MNRRRKDDAAICAAIAEYQKDNTDTTTQITSKNTDEAQSYSQAKNDDQSNNVYQEIVNEENKQKNRAYVEHVMSRIDEYWDVPVKSNGQSLVASFNIAENGAVSGISFKGKADKEFEKQKEQGSQQPCFVHCCRRQFLCCHVCFCFF